MSKRLQVLMDEKDWKALQQEARRHGVTVSEWVRQALRAARRESSAVDPARKLASVRASLRHEFPTADIEQMLAEIERGYAG
jgi:hypothetical protein